jgi:hypothetical protein
MILPHNFWTWYISGFIIVFIILKLLKPYDHVKGTWGYLIGRIIISLMSWGTILCGLIIAVSWLIGEIIKMILKLINILADNIKPPKWL